MPFGFVVILKYFADGPASASLALGMFMVFRYFWYFFLFIHFAFIISYCLKDSAALVLRHTFFTWGLIYVSLNSL
ncbi:hypothetical protein, partial [Pseudomonas sp. RTB2]|uniref:hypothetical protein n=1 Tax=Pseudomonas sp. RTB2 TaxID=3048632 RepID=UPI002B22F4E5